MRVSTFQQYNSYKSRIAKTQSDYYMAQQEVLTGKKQNLMSNDPAGASAVIRAKDLSGALNQYKTNLQTAKDFAGTTESTLGDMGDMMKQVNTLLLQGANSSMDQSARTAIANQIGDIQKRMVSLMNTQGASAQYIFAGQNSGVKPYSLNATSTGLVFSGDDFDANVEIGPGELLAVNTAMSTQMIAAYDTIEKIKTDMAGGNISALSDVDLGLLQNSMQVFREQRGEAGSKLQQISALSTQHQRRIDDLNQHISNVEDVDLSEAITKMQLAQTSYQATLQVTASASRMSLMDYIR
ncbi:MAG: hypothetical protein K8R88_01600 [Armatimonadetes bacterium]|nr:hypothetical protein [Armatimonadota bacterium]